MSKSGGRYARNRGNNFERELVNEAKDAGLSALRAYGSNGRSLGCVEQVDLVVGGARIQAKRKKALPKWSQIPEGADAVVFREDSGASLVLIPYEQYLRFLRAEVSQ